MALDVSWFGKWLNLRSCSPLGMCGTILSSGNTSTPPSTWCVKIFNPSIHLSFQAPYLEKKLRKIYEGEAYKFYRQSDKVSHNQMMLIV